MKLALVPWLLVTAAAIAFSAADPSPSAPKTQGVARSIMSRAAAAEDLRTWADRVVEVHPLLDSPEAAGALRLQVEELVDSLPATLDSRWLHARWSALAATLHDSHTTVGAAPELSEHPPIPITVDGYQLCLRADLGAVKAGSCFMSFGGVSAADVVKWIIKTAPHETDDGWRTQAPRFLPFALSALEVPAGSEAVVRTSAGNYESLSLPGWETFEPPPAEEAINLDVDEQGIARLTIRTFDGAQEEFFEEAFSRVFRALAEGKAKGLIVDLRGNGGGSTHVAQLLLDHLTTSEYRMMGAKRWRVSKTMQQHLRNNGETTGRYLEASPGGELLGEVPMYAPISPPNLFTGPVFFLCDRNTRSTAMMLLDAVQTFHLAGILGEPPASPPNYFGEVYRYTAEHSGLSIGISTAQFVRASGDALDPSRVRPHVPLSTFRVDGSRTDVAVAEATRLIERWLARMPTNAE